MQTIYLDISNKGAIPAIHAKQGDVGRKFLAIITDSGVPHRLDSADLFSVWYEGDSGDGNYSEIDGHSAFSVNGNKIVVELVTQMVTNHGKGVLSLVVNDRDGHQIGLWNIDYIVEAVPGMDSPEADQYYTAFLNSVKEMALVGVESPSFPGCYYRVVNGETEWLNPPMVTDEEYRTTERYMGKAVYTCLVNTGALANGMTSIKHSLSMTQPLSCQAAVEAEQSIPARYYDAQYDQTLSVYVTYANIFIHSSGVEGDALGKDVYCILKYTKD